MLTPGPGSSAPPRPPHPRIPPHHPVGLVPAGLAPTSLFFLTATRRHPPRRHPHLPPPWRCNRTAQCCPTCHISQMRNRDRCRHVSHPFEPQLDPCRCRNLLCPALEDLPACSSPFMSSPASLPALLWPIPSSSPPDGPFSHLMENSDGIMGWGSVSTSITTPTNSLHVYPQPFLLTPKQWQRWYLLWGLSTPPPRKLSSTEAVSIPASP